MASTSSSPAASSSSLPPPPIAFPVLPLAPRGPATRIPFFTPAEQPEIVRANQKDLYYLSQLTERVEDVFRSLLGTRWLQRWSVELNQGSRLAYFGLTTLLGSQTLGEEYCDILQYAVTDRKPPSPRRRAALLSFQILLPYLLARLYSSLRIALLARAALLALPPPVDPLESLFPGELPPPPPMKAKSRLEKVMSALAKGAEAMPSFETLTNDYLRSVHLSLFYLWGRYYHLSNRFTGIRFISTQSKRSAASPSAASNAPPSSYEVLGVLMIVQLSVRALLALYRYRASSPLQPSSPSDVVEEKPKSAKKGRFTVDGRELATFVFDPEDPDQASPYPEEESAAGGSDKRCTLCLGAKRDPTATECGHVFCWECIVGWAREKSECPLCRQTIALSKFLPLYNL